MRMLPLCLVVSLVAPSARAEWQYTRWGMTPEQVVAASGGRAELLPVARRPRIPPLVTAATGQFVDGPLRLRTVFSFDIESNGLQCVSYGVSSHADNNAFKEALIRHYGQPQATRTIPLVGMTELDWKTGTDEVTASFSKDDPAYAMHCKKD